MRASRRHPPGARRRGWVGGGGGHSGRTAPGSGCSHAGRPRAAPGAPPPPHPPAAARGPRGPLHQVRAHGRPVPARRHGRLDMAQSTSGGLFRYGGMSKFFGEAPVLVPNPAWWRGGGRANGGHGSRQRERDRLAGRPAAGRGAPPRSGHLGGMAAYRHPTQGPVPQTVRRHSRVCAVPLAPDGPPSRGAVPRLPGSAPSSPPLRVVSGARDRVRAPDRHRHAAKNPSETG